MKRKELYFVLVFALSLSAITFSIIMAKCLMYDFLDFILILSLTISSSLGIAYLSLGTVSKDSEDKNIFYKISALLTLISFLISTLLISKMEMSQKYDELAFIKIPSSSIVLMLGIIGIYVMFYLSSLVLNKKFKLSR